MNSENSEMELQPISAEFPYRSRFVRIKGSNLHYIEEGKGDPVLFLHDIPTWSYLWRNIIPYISPMGRAIAVDFIGMGKSDKPDIAYSVFDHIDYISSFIEALDLSRLTLVLHGWGSVIGFHYAMKHPHRIKALAFLESYLRPATNIDMVSLPLLEMASVLNTPDGGYDVIMHSNYFINKVMPSGILRTLSQAEMAQYQLPFQTPGTCKPLWQFLQELPLGEEESSPIVDLIRQYSTALTRSPLPKLMFYAVPGFLTTIDTVKWAKDNLPNLTLVEIGDALHYPQESDPKTVGTELAKWYQQIKG